MHLNSICEQCILIQYASNCTYSLWFSSKFHLSILPECEMKSMLKGAAISSVS